MFGSKKAPIFTEQVETVIGKETRIVGTVSGNGTLRIDGQLEGELDITGDLIVGESAHLQAKVKANNITIAGSVVGNVDAAQRLELAPTARLQGDIKVSALVIGEGAVFKGACEMRAEEAPRGKT